jgi:hypothetical protein
MTEHMIGERWSSRLVATASENRLNPRRNAHVVRGSQRLPNNRDFMSTRPSLGRVLINAQIAALRAQKNGQLEAERRAC